MVIDPRRMPPGANLFSRGSVLYYQHPEPGDRVGFAEYNSRRRAFRCPTCNFRLSADQMNRPCITDECGGTMIFDDHALICNRDAQHRIGPDPLP